MRKAGPLLLSVLLHAGLVGLALLNWPRATPELTVGAVPVTIVSDVVAESAPNPDPTNQPEAEETDPALDTETTEVAETEPVPAPPRPNQPRPETPPRKTTTPTPTPNPRPDTSNASRPAPNRPTESAGLDLDAIAGERPARPRPNRPNPGDSGEGRARTTTGPQWAAIGEQISDNWRVQCAVAGVDDLVVEVRLTLSSEGRVVQGPTIVNPRPDPVFRAAAEAMLRAVRAAEPLEVPDGFTTQSRTFRFLARDACGR